MTPTELVLQWGSVPRGEIAIINSSGFPGAAFPDEAPGVCIDVSLGPHGDRLTGLSSRIPGSTDLEWQARPVTLVRRAYLGGDWGSLEDMLADARRVGRQIADDLAAQEEVES